LPGLICPAPIGHRLRFNVGSCRRVTRARDLCEISRPTAIPIPPRIAPTTGMPAIKMMTNIDSSIGGMPRGTMEGVKDMIPGAQHLALRERRVARD
jgi:hypothetical protein